MMDVLWVTFWVQLAQFLMMCGIGFYVYISNKDRVTNGRIGKLEKDLDRKLDGHIERIVAVETRSEAALTSTDLNGIHEKINKIGNDINLLSGEFSGVRNLLNTLHTFLLGRRGGKTS
jgi:hypothetical protein